MENEKQETDDIEKFFNYLMKHYAVTFIIVIGVLIYFNALFNSFVWDDITYIVNNQDVHTLNLLHLLGENFFNTINQYRPIPALYFALIYVLFGLQSFFY